MIIQTIFFETVTKTIPDYLIIIYCVLQIIIS